MGTKEFEYFNMFITFLKTYYNGNFPKTVTELRKTAPFCYKILQKFNPKIHVKYSDILQTDKNYEADFVISNDIIEVSNFKINYKNYFETIKIKNNIVENNGFSFYFLTSLKEVKEYAYKLEMKI